MEHVAQELNGLEPNFAGGLQTVGLGHSSNATACSSAQLTAANGSRVNLPNSSGLSRTGQVTGISRAGNSVSIPSNLCAVSSILPLLRSSVTGVPAHVSGDLNTTIIGLGDDGGHGGGWAPLVALKKVLRGILKYLGVLWLFGQLPDLLKEILGSLKDNEGVLLNLDQEQPTLLFFVGMKFPHFSGTKATFSLGAAIKAYTKDTSSAFVLSFIGRIPDATYWRQSQIIRSFSVFHNLDFGGRKTVWK